MLHLSPAVRYYLYTGHTDMRKGFDSLCGIISSQIPTPSVTCGDGRNWCRWSYIFSALLWCPPCVPDDGPQSVHPAKEEATYFDAAGSLWKQLVVICLLPCNQDNFCKLNDVWKKQLIYIAYLCINTHEMLKIKKRGCLLLRQPLFYVYTLHTFSKKCSKYYIGFTSGSVEQRLAKHLANNSGFTGKAKDWTLVHTEIFETKQQAMQREREIKNWKSHKLITRLIESSSAE